MSHPIHRVNAKDIEQLVATAKKMLGEQAVETRDRVSTCSLPNDWHIRLEQSLNLMDEKFQAAVVPLRRVVYLMLGLTFLSLCALVVVSLLVELSSLWRVGGAAAGFSGVIVFMKQSWRMWQDQIWLEATPEKYRFAASLITNSVDARALLDHLIRDLEHARSTNTP